MERRLITNSVCLTLLFLFAPIATGQGQAQRESSDPYFKTKNSWNASSPLDRLPVNRLQPRTSAAQSPSSNQLAPMSGQTQPRPSTNYPLQPQLQPKPSPSRTTQLTPRKNAHTQNANPQTYQPDGKNDFRPRGLRTAKMDDPRFMSDGSFSSQSANAPLTPRKQFRAAPQQSNFAPNTAQQQKPALKQKRLFEEVDSNKPFRFEQSEEFETPDDFKASSASPSRQRPIQKEKPAPSNRNRDFTQAETSIGSMRTSTAMTQTPQQETRADEFEPGRVVAIVGGRPIFVGDMLFEVNQFLDQVMPGAPAKAKEVQRGLVIKKMIPKFIDSKLLLIDTLNSLPEGADFEKVVESAQNDFDEKVLPTIMEKSNVQSELELDAKLRAQGGSLRQLRYKWAEEQLIKYFIGQKLDVNTDVSHQEMLAKYQANLDQYRQKAKVRWEELAIRFEKVPNRAEAEALVKKMGNEVVYGASFEAVARKSSQGFTASEGGKHDWTSKGALVYKDVERALFSIPLNELSDVIPSKDGFHIVRVLERTQESFTPFLEAQVEIKSQIENEKRAQAFEDHLTKLRRRIPFEVQMDDVELPEHLAEQTRNIR